MGLLIKSEKEKQIKISGTDFVVNEVYARITFVAKPNGREMEVATNIYANQQMYEEGKLLYTDIPPNNFNIVLQEGESQSIQTALAYSKLGFEQLGYACEIVPEQSLNNDIPNTEE